MRRTAAVTRGRSATRALPEAHPQSGAPSTAAALSPGQAKHSANHIRLVEMTDAVGQCEMGKCPCTRLSLVKGLRPCGFAAKAAFLLDDPLDQSWIDLRLPPVGAMRSHQFG